MIRPKIKRGLAYAKNENAQAIDSQENQKTHADTARYSSSYGIHRTVLMPGQHRTYRLFYQYGASSPTRRGACFMVQSRNVVVLFGYQHRYRRTLRQIR